MLIGVKWGLVDSQQWIEGLFILIRMDGVGSD